MSVDVQQQAWVGAFEGCGPGAFDAAFRHAQELVVGHLLGPLAVPIDQALALTRRTMIDTLETIANNRSADEPLSRIAGTARILLRKLVRAELGNAAGLDVDFEPEPDGSTLGAFYDGVPGVDEQLARRFGLPPFLELVHLAVCSLPAAERAVVGAADEASAQLCDVAGALLIAWVEPAGGCLVLGQHLDRADWRPGQPYDPVLRARVLHHVGTCPACAPRHEQAVGRIESLPAVLLPTVLGLYEHRADQVEAVRAAQPDEPPTELIGPPIAAPISTLLSPPGDAGVVPPEPPPPGPLRPERSRSRRRPVALVALGVLVVLGLGLAALLSGPSGSPGDTGPNPTGAVNAVGESPGSGPTPVGPSSSAPAGTSASASPTAGGPTVTASSPASSAPVSSPVGSSPVGSPQSRPASSPPASASAPASRPGSSAPAPPGPPASSAPPPAGQLTISMGALSTGRLDVTVAGASAGSCGASDSQCAFAFHVGDTVRIDPVDVVSSWPGPCAGTSTSATCTFVASADVSMRVGVFRSL
jgi:hypothetical protein